VENSRDRSGKKRGRTPREEEAKLVKKKESRKEQNEGTTKPLALESGRQEKKQSETLRPDLAGREDGRAERAMTCKLKSLPKGGCNGCAPHLTSEGRRKNSRFDQSGATAQS